MKESKVLNSREYANGKGQFSTNNVLIHKKKQTQIHAYFPAYFRLNFHNFLQIDLANLTSVVDLTLTFDVYYGDFFKSDNIFEKQSEYLKKIEDQHKENEENSEDTKEKESKKNKDRIQTNKQYVIGKLMRKLRFNFTQDEAIYLSEENSDNESLHLMEITHFQEELMIEYEIRKTFKIQLEGDLTWSPFEIIHSILEITVQPLIVKIEKKNFVFKVNIMEPIYDSEFFIDENTAYGQYGLASSLVGSIYSNFRVPVAEEFKMSSIERGMHLMQKYQKQLTRHFPDDSNKDLKVQEPDILWFQYAIFNIPMYKHPLSSIATVFVPLWLLGLINLGIYFQDQSLSDRIGSIIALMIAFITYVPTIQKSIPPSSRIVFMQIVVYCQSLAVLCTFIHSIRISNFSDGKYFLQWTLTPEYIVAVVIVAISFGMVTILMLIHYIVWHKYYSQKKESLRQTLTKQLVILKEKQTINGEQAQDEQRGKLNQKDREEDKDKQDKFLDYIATLLGPYHSPNKIFQSSFSQNLNRQDWANLLCDIYFNYFFNYRKEQSNQSPLNDSGKPYQNYFLIDLKTKEDYEKISPKQWSNHPLKKIAEKSSGVKLRSDKFQFLKLKLAQNS